MSDTPALDITARRLAEGTYSAYAQQASGSIHPQHEQTLLTRLAEAARPAVADSPGATVNALNAALDAFEQAEPGIRGPRLAAADVATGEVRLATG
ncbi:hypothetical protein [Methylobacterium gnaphalii]|uniref:Uncharacterized protein n=1 Tax=Methylobacterium gnaphalii TaxID=1010610 RepID=A0A512JR30_9HYPH|nr:hypothetical protein [Methylobacterium gnaphalii]GEP12333.1 hypothetical protein MGN01_41780 [Methylobacterium gnaphalii]GJD69096.1 hypothetical protein MMMDOFMJ_2022 [Methylobacterium gnaphalii]GLS48543.1 hypothetical protein GCM10007885_13870 [Methylobacterium gnaphalii]